MYSTSSSETFEDGGCDLWLLFGFSSTGSNPRGEWVEKEKPFSSPSISLWTNSDQSKQPAAGETHGLDTERKTFSVQTTAEEVKWPSTGSSTGIKPQPIL